MPASHGTAAPPRPALQVEVDHVYVDMNSLLHTTLRKANTLEKFHELLHKRYGVPSASERAL